MGGARHERGVLGLLELAGGGVGDERARLLHQGDAEAATRRGGQSRRGYYIAIARSAAYELENELEADGRTVEAGTLAVDAEWMYMVNKPGKAGATTRWYYLNSASPLSFSTIPVDQILTSCFEMADAARSTQNAQQRSRATSLGAVVLSSDDHDEIMDELEQR